MALAIDASTPAFASSNTGAAVTTASFTPPTGAVLVAVAFHDTASGNLTNTSVVTGGGLTWTIQATRNRADAGGQNAHVQVSTAVVASSASMTVTTTGTNCLGPVGVYVFVMTGADTTTPFDDLDEASNTSGVVSIAMTTVTDQAWGFLAVTDWNVAAAMTAGASQTAVLSTGIGPGPDVRVYIGRQSAVTSPAGAVTMSTGSPSTGNTNNYIAWAVKPSAGGGPTNYTQTNSGAVTPAAVLVRQAVKVLAGTCAPTGAVTRQAAKRQAGTLTPAGALVRRTAKAFTAAITPGGALALLKAALRSFTGGVTPTGGMARQTGKALAGVVAPSGAVRRSTSKLLIGAIAGAGSVLKQTAKRFLGSLAPAGGVSTSTGPPAEVRNVRFTVGAPESAWSASLTTAPWHVGEPHPNWTTGPPEV